MPKQTNFIRTQVRLDPDLYEAIKQVTGDRSMNETIQQLLWIALAQHGEAGSETDTTNTARLAALERRVAELERLIIADKRR